jgi:arsenite methyltransferase
MRTFTLALLAGSLISAQVAHQHHPPSTDEYAKVLEDPERDTWQKPHEVITALKLKPSDVVADIGAGTGYFSRRFAMHAAKIYAVDIDAKLLEIAAKTAPKNLVTLLAKPDDALLPPASVDLVFFCDVVHHIQDRVAYYNRLKPALKPGARIVVIDFYKKELPLGPPPEMKLTEDMVTSELKQAGFRPTRKETFLQYQYFLEFSLYDSL